MKRSRIQKGRVLLTGVLALAASGNATAKSGVSPTVISLPSGPGAIEGLGKSFEPQLNTGSASYGIAITVPPGVAGHQPAVDLSYGSGGGNGPLGIGWSLNMPEIRRQVDKGIPKYTGAEHPDPDSEDVFLYNGEELVPLSDGTYRCENETEFIRFRKIVSDAGTKPIAWEAAMPDGEKLVFGGDAGSRVTRAGGLSDSFADTYCWNLTTDTDTSGNRIQYSYETFEPDSSGLNYLSQIEYARFSDLIHHRVRFIYSGSAEYPETRTDVFSDFRPGFEVKTSRLLREIAVKTDDVLVRRYRLDYQPDPDLSPISENEIPLGFNLLQSVTQFDRSGSDDNYLPPTRFAYSRFATAGEDAAKFMPIEGGFNFLRFAPGQTTVTDINSDGLPDFVSSSPDGWYAYLNTGDGRFSDEVPFTADGDDGTDQSIGKQLFEPSITLADLDADGITNLFQKSAASDRILYHRNLNDYAAPSTLDSSEVVRWGPEEEFQNEAQVGQFGALDITAPSIRLLDLNFDKRTDVMRPFDFGDGTGGVEYIFNEPDGWRSELLFPGDPRLPGDWSPDEARFDGASVTGLADLNGDRLADWYVIARVGEQLWLDYWPNANGGFWGERRVTQRIETGGLLASEIRVMDVNADGLSDLVRVENFQLKFWINVGGDAWSDAIIRDDAPFYQEGLTVLHEMDVNGNGTTDLVWDNAAIDPGSLPPDHPTLLYLDFVGRVKPNLLTAIDNGIGLRTFIEYKSTTDDYLAAHRSGHPWTTKLPFAMPIVARMIEDVGLDLNGDGVDDEYITDYTYRDGFYDSFEKEFRGFGFVEKIERGDDYDPETGDTAYNGTGFVSGPSTVTRIRYHTGAPDGVDNDDYLDGFKGPVAIDEGTGTGAAIVSFTDDRGGREEESIKGFTLFEEVVDPAVLSSDDPDASFHACARRAALVSREDPDSPEAFRCTPDKYVYTRERTEWRIRRLYRPADVINPPGRFADRENATPVHSLVEKSVSFAVPVSSRTDTIEANQLLTDRFSDGPTYPQRDPVSVFSETDYDDFGNPVRSAEYGIVEGDDLSARDDERISRTIFNIGAEEIERWMLRFPSISRIEDENGVFVSELHHFYDGSELEGLPNGEVGARGLLKRQDSVITGESPVPNLDAHDPEDILIPGDPRLGPGSKLVSRRWAHDRYGNVIVQMDGLGDPGSVAFSPSTAAPESAAAAGTHPGHFEIIRYDAERHIYPEEELLGVGGGNADLSLKAGYDPGFGQVTSSTDFNGNITRYIYDSFARLVAIIRPGDSEERPTLRYAYRPMDGHRRLSYDYDETGALVGGAPSATLASSANAVDTWLREDEPGADSYNAYRMISYSAGNGQALMQVHEDETEGRWIVSEASLFNLRAGMQSRYQPYYRADSEYHEVGEGGIRHDGKPVTETDRADNLADPLGRVIRILNPPETDGGVRAPALVHHLPFETATFDEEDAAPGGTRYDTPTVRHRDGLGRLNRVDETVGTNDAGEPVSSFQVWSTRYAYDLNDKLVRIVDSQNNVKWMRHDGLGREIYMNDPDRGEVRTVFDDASNAIETVDAKGQRRTYTYDGRGRILTEDFHDTGMPNSRGRDYDPSLAISTENQPDVRFIYDTPADFVDFGDGESGRPRNTKGLLVAVVDLAGEEYYSYTARGLAEWEVRRIPDPIHGRLVSYKTEMTYDSDQRLRHLRFPDGDRVGFVYNSRSLLEQIEGGAEFNRNGNPYLISEIDYLPSGHIRRCLLGNGVETHVEHDPRMRVRRLVTREPVDQRELIDYHYDFDRVGNISKITDQRAAPPIGGSGFRNTQEFEYDDLYRLTKAGIPAATSIEGQVPETDYRYDRLGNLVHQSSGFLKSDTRGSLVNLGDLAYGGGSGTAGRIGRRPGDDPGPRALTGTTRDAACEYDANGNLTNAEDVRYEWDFKDRLVAVETPGLRAEYLYDYSDQRAVKKVFVRNAEGELPEMPTDSVVYVDEYFEIRSNDQPVKHVWNGPLRVASVTGTIDPQARRLQRFRILPGWNLFSLALETDDATGQLGIGTGDPVEAALIWNAESKVFEPLTAGGTMNAGAVFWLRANRSGTLTVSGTSVDSTASPIAAGGHFVPVRGIRSARLDAFFQAGAERIWLFDANSQDWRYPAGADGLPETTSADSAKPFDALFVRSSQGFDVPSESSASEVLYYHNDHLTSVEVCTDGAANVVFEAVYFPFGLVRAEKSPELTARSYLYTQKELDAESGLICMEARYTAPHLGRFLSVDLRARTPGGRELEDPQLLHSYSYARNNPQTYTDPDGEFAMTALGAITGAVMGAFDAAVDAGKSRVRHPGAFTWKKVAAKVALGAAIGAAKGAAVGAFVDATIASGGATLGAAVLGVGGAMAIGAGTGAAGEGIRNAINQKIDFGLSSSLNGAEIKSAMKMGAIAGAVGGGISGGGIAFPGARTGLQIAGGVLKSSTLAKGAVDTFGTHKQMKGLEMRGNMAQARRQQAAVPKMARIPSSVIARGNRAQLQRQIARNTPARTIRAGRAAQAKRGR